MTKPDRVAVTLPADVQQIDDTGYVWSFLDEARRDLRLHKWVEGSPFIRLGLWTSPVGSR